MAFTIEIEPASSKNQMAARLQIIADLIDDGDTSGSYPSWTLTETNTEED